MQVAVIGSGTMGNGIAHVFAQYGFVVQLYDISDAALQKALQTIQTNAERQVAKQILSPEQKDSLLANIHLKNELRAAVSSADLVVEAASENPEIKKKIFKDLNLLCKADAILASNTSSISITQIAAVVNNPERVIGMHFMNPVPIMKLVEIIRGYATSDAVTKQVMDVSKQLNKIPVEVNDYPGFVSNRILMPMINEAIETLFEGVAGVEEIDAVMKLGMAHPMGPLQLADFIGLDTCLSILNVLHQGFGRTKYAPCPLLVNMVTAGNLGVKSGKGFYEYEKGSKELKVAAKFSKR